MTAPTSKRAEILAVIQPFRASVVDVAPKSITIQVTGDGDRLTLYFASLPYGIQNLARTVQQDFQDIFLVKILKLVNICLTQAVKIKIEKRYLLWHNNGIQKKMCVAAFDGKISCYRLWIQVMLMLKTCVTQVTMLSLGFAMVNHSTKQKKMVSKHMSS